MIRILNFIVIILLMPVSAWCLTATVKVDKTDVSMEDAVHMQVIADVDTADIDTSAIKDFEVEYIGTSTSVSIVNTSVSKEIRYQYRLFPLKEGDLVIGPLVVRSGDESVSTRKISVSVKKSPVEGAKKDDIFATASVSSQNLYMGQQAVYTFELFSAVHFSQATLHEPGFNGFEARPIGEKKQYTTRINGRVYSVSQIRFSLVPVKSGVHDIEPAVVSARIAQQGRRDPFDGFFGDSFFSSVKTRPVRVTTEPLQVTVSPLPPFDAGKRFSGLVGEFKIQSGIDTSSLTVGQSATWTVTVSGKGNIMDALLPKIQLDDAVFKVYDDDPEEDITITQEGYSGSKTFKKALVPLADGSFVLPRVSLTYFDVTMPGYRTVSTDPVPVTVKASKASTPQITGTQGSMDRAREKKAVRFTQKDILTIDEDPSVLVSRRQMSPWIFAVLLLLPALFFWCFKGLLRLKNKTVPHARQMARRSEILLKQAVAASPDDPEFLSLLHAGLMARIRSRADIPAESLTNKEIEDLLEKKGFASHDVRQVSRLVSNIESARFSGLSVDRDTGIELLEKTKHVFKLLTLLLCAVMVFCCSPGKVEAAGADDVIKTFQKGVLLYHEQQYAGAAEKFESIARSGITSGKLYYNTGNAFLKAGDTGRAILWYERAAKWIPNDPDLKFNLAYARSLVTDKPGTADVSLHDILFFWLSFLPVNTIQVTAIAMSALFFLVAGIGSVMNRPVLKTLEKFLVSLMIVFSALALYDYYHSMSRNHAVVISRTAVVRSGMSQAATGLFDLHAGTRVKVRKTTPTHLQIVFSRDKIGWIDRAHIEII